MERLESIGHDGNVYDIDRIKASLDRYEHRRDLEELVKDRKAMEKIQAIKENRKIDET